MDTKLVKTQPYRLEKSYRQLMKFGRDNGWRFNHLGKAPLPTQSVYLGDWLIVPAQFDSSDIPARTLERIQTIYATGYNPAGWVVVHEAPNLLMAPKPARSASSRLWQGLAVLGGAAALGSILSSIIPLLGAAAVVDPILVLVTPELDWIEIDRWII